MKDREVYNLIIPQKILKCKKINKITIVLAIITIAIIIALPYIKIKENHTFNKLLNLYHMHMLIGFIGFFVLVLVYTSLYQLILKNKIKKKTNDSKLND